VWKVEERLVTHPNLQRISGDTVGTLRLTSFRMADGTVELAPGVLKIPVGSSGLDHFSHGTGQLAAPVDDATGRIGPAHYWRQLGACHRHPLTGVEFVGELVPHWNAACDMARATSAALPALRTMGCDIAITKAGPVLIEVNPAWGERIIQAAWQTGLVQGSFRAFLEELGADDILRHRARQL
jgi:hypothetical protein